MTEKTKDSAVYLDIDKRIFETVIKPLITKELIEEHRMNPIGKHSENLGLVLRYFRRHHEQLEGKDVIICTKPEEEWHLGEYPDERGKRPTIFLDESFGSVEAAEHGLFLKRLKKYGVEV
ncbi:hypothetical protein [Aneurinibacillus migulanus]|uniref:hypothetical protein n=1 Tax=Aneurinibacillus migulanus TaxID=47500 RepID=UPI000696A5F2|nr:hypothetical protein [Aneurinibacillus migulanus]MCP1358015.1 hypothetical protein [Aneurinibacillus migulanus]